ncbi:MAG: ATPase, partial [Acidobacteria bacterium]|nr:ATPase [Acidobacteriota bacterium]
MIIPTTMDQLAALITNQVSEDLHLDYKRSAEFDNKSRDEVKTALAKDVSAFANSDGGVLVYGVVENNTTKLAEQIDDGVDHMTWTRERIESMINANISPRIDGLEIYQIRMSTDRSAYVIAIPKSARGPHQERVTGRYYKRFNFCSERMEDYEIQDVRNRRDVVLPLISVDADIHQGVAVHLVIENIGEIPAEDVHFKVTPDVERLTIGPGTPNILTRGAQFIPPRKIYRFFFGSAIEKVQKQSAPKFDVEVSYFNRHAGQRVSETF